MSEYYGVTRTDDAHLEHHGVKGQKWGVRRKGYVAKGIYSKHPDGYDYNKNKKNTKALNKYREGTNIGALQKSRSQVNKDKVKKAVGVGLVVAGSVLAAYGAYKLYQHAKNGSLSPTSPPDFNGVKKINIERFEPERIKINRVEPDRVDVNRLFDSLSTNGQRRVTNNSNFNSSMKKAQEFTEALLKRRVA